MNNTSKCDRCGNDLRVWIMSWFTTESICMDCSAKESEIKRALRAKGIMDAMEGCGYIPDPTQVNSVVTTPIIEVEQVKE